MNPNNYNLILGVAALSMSSGIGYSNRPVRKSSAGDKHRAERRRKRQAEKASKRRNRKGTQ